MKKVVLTGNNLTPKNVREEIIRRATKETQGAYAIVKKSSTVKVLLFLDNNQILFKENESIKTFVCEEFLSVEFLA